MDTKRDYVTLYHALLRPEIASQIPKTAKKILDLGCGSGALGKHIKKRQHCTYHGIEINERAAHLAKESMDRVFCYDIEAYPATNTKKDYDTLVCADILEHLNNPEETLKHFVGELTENGTIIASIPNVAHQSIKAELANGLFRYTNAGILDRTHLRFFTLPTIFQLFAKLDLKITRTTPHPRQDNPVQWIITAKKAPSYRQEKSATIIIPVHNNFAMTKQTLQSIKKSTKISHKIIVVNNASMPEMTKWLEQNDDVLEIRLEKNLGFPIAVNLGMEISNTPYLVIANNDIIVTHNWLRQMIDCADRSKTWGIVGPMTGYVSGPQLDKTADYTTLDGLESHSALVTQRMRGIATPFPRIVFFCVLIKKRVVDTIGLLDEGFSPGNYEDDDYCLRAIEAGFKTIIDRATFIHHYGSQSWKENWQEYERILARNRRYFDSKWGTRADVLRKPSS